MVQGAGHLHSHGVTRPGPHHWTGAAQALLDHSILLGPAEDERLLAKGSPSCTCDIALSPGTILMDWREFRGEPGTQGAGGHDLYGKFKRAA